MGAENFMDGSVTGKRSARRSRVLIAAKLETAAGEIDVRLRDLSRKGALVEADVIPAVDSEVMFLRGSIVVPARVAWTAGKRIGLQFRYMIDESEVLVQLNRKTAAATGERFRRPRLHEALSEHDRKMARAWGLAVGLSVPE